MTDPKRREVRRTHLDASAVPVERALLSRAAMIGAEDGTVRRALRAAGVSQDTRLNNAVADAVAEIVEHEFRYLAEELHWW